MSIRLLSSDVQYVTALSPFVAHWIRPADAFADIVQISTLADVLDAGILVDVVVTSQSDTPRLRSAVNWSDLIETETTSEMIDSSHRAEVSSVDEEQTRVTDAGHMVEVISTQEAT